MYTSIYNVCMYEYFQLMCALLYTFSRIKAGCSCLYSGLCLYISMYVCVHTGFKADVCMLIHLVYVYLRVSGYVCVFVVCG